MAEGKILDLLRSHRVVLCVGSGGVGKTTTTAALATLAAQQGLRVLALTIDPARRLVTSFGLADAPKAPARIDPDRFAEQGAPLTGELSVMVLDAKSTFDDLVGRYASSAEARQRIFDNPLYHVLSTKLAGTGEYMAMETLLELKDRAEYDLIVLDTPPTKNALDFLSAPDRMVSALDSSAMRWFVDAFTAQRRLSLNLVSRGVALVLRGLGRITSTRFLGTLASLIVDLDDLFGGFRQRSLRVADAFRTRDFAYVVVTSPDPVALREAAHFADHLLQQGMQTDAVIVNRVRPRVPEVDVAEVAAALGRVGVPLGPDSAERIEQVLAEERKLAERDQARVQEARDLLGVRRLTLVPALPGDVHDIDGVVRVAAALGA